jgi:hypothetical protein
MKVSVNRSNDVMEVQDTLSRKAIVKWDRHSVEKALKAALKIDHRTTNPHGYLEHLQPPTSDHQRFAADALGWLNFLGLEEGLMVQKWLWMGSDIARCDVAAGESPLDALSDILNEKGVAAVEPPLIVEDYFGGCPVCGKNDGHLNVGRDHYVYCSAHKKRSCYGSNLFSGWRDEDEPVWKRNWGILDQCEDTAFLVEGVWSAEPEARRRELDVRARDWHAEVEERRRRSKRHARRLEDVVRVTIEALTPVAEGMTSDEADIAIIVEGDIVITLGAKGVCREAAPDVPF